MVLLCSPPVSTSYIIFPFILVFICIILYQIAKISQYISKNSKLRGKLRKGELINTKNKNYKADIGLILIPATILLLAISIISFILIPVFIFILSIIIMSTYGSLCEANEAPRPSSHSTQQKRAAGLKVKPKPGIKKSQKFDESQFCAKCGMKFAEDALFCHNCGKSIHSKIRFCAYCGTYKLKNAMFCHRCGNTISTQKYYENEGIKKNESIENEKFKSCSYCGVRVESFGVFCPSCGNKL